MKQLKKDLEANGLSVWLDTDDIQLGTDWRAEITTGVACFQVNLFNYNGVLIVGGLVVSLQ